jgi:hypothetical protein
MTLNGLLKRRQSKLSIPLLRKRREFLPKRHQSRRRPIGKKELSGQGFKRYNRRRQFSGIRFALEMSQYLLMPSMNTIKGANRDCAL